MVKYPPFNFFRIIFYPLDERMVIYMNNTWKHIVAFTIIQIALLLLGLAGNWAIYFEYEFGYISWPKAILLGNLEMLAVACALLLALKVFLRKLKEGAE